MTSTKRMIRYFVLSTLLGLVGASCQKKVIEPEGCRTTLTLDQDTYTYQFDTIGRLTHLWVHTAGNDLDYAYAYQGNQATIELTYPHSSWLRFRYELTLDPQSHVLTAQTTMYNTLADGTVEEKVAASHTCSYDADGYLTTYYTERYSYDLNKARTTTDRADVLISYQDGNPVTITYSGSDSRNGTMTNQYGTQANPTKLAFWLETNPVSFSPETALQPLLGKPSRRLISRSQLTGSRPLTLTYTYQLDGLGTLVGARRTGPVLVAPFSWLLTTTCP